MVIIRGFRYLVELGPGSDVWSAWGEVSNHPKFRNGECVYISTPKEYDKQTKILKTASGRIYQIESFADNDVDKWEKEIETDIANGGSQLL